MGCGRWSSVRRVVGRTAKVLPKMYALYRVDTAYQTVLAIASPLRVFSDTSTIGFSDISVEAGRGIARLVLWTRWICTSILPRSCTLAIVGAVSPVYAITYRSPYDGSKESPLVVKAPNVVSPETH